MKTFRKSDVNTGIAKIRAGEAMTSPSMDERKACVDHLNFVRSTCPDCGLEVDPYGNTEASFEYCCFPDCGCDGARLCMAPSGASDDAGRANVEGMYGGKSKAHQRGRMELLALCAKGKRP